MPIELMKQVVGGDCNILRHWRRHHLGRARLNIDRKRTKSSTRRTEPA